MSKPSTLDIQVAEIGINYHIKDVSHHKISGYCMLSNRREVFCMRNHTSLIYTYPGGYINLVKKTVIHLPKIKSV